MCCGGVFLPPPDYKPSFSKEEAWVHLFLCLAIGLGGGGAVATFVFVYARCLWRDFHAGLWSDPARVAASLGGAAIISCLGLAICPGGIRHLYAEVRKSLHRLREPD